MNERRNNCEAVRESWRESLREGEMKETLSWIVRGREGVGEE